MMRISLRWRFAWCKSCHGLVWPGRPRVIQIRIGAGAGRETYHRRCFLRVLRRAA